MKVEILRKPLSHEDMLLITSKAGNGLFICWLPKQVRARYQPKFPGPYIAIYLWFFGISFAWSIKNRQDLNSKIKEHRANDKTNSQMA